MINNYSDNFQRCVEIVSLVAGRYLLVFILVSLFPLGERVLRCLFSFIYIYIIRCGARIRVQFIYIKRV